MRPSTEQSTPQTPTQDLDEPNSPAQQTSRVTVADGRDRLIPSGPPAVGPGRLPDPRPLAGELARAVVEVLAGDRPVGQLLTRLDSRTYGQLSARAPAPATAPIPARARAGIHPTDRPRVCTVHVSHPAAGVAEITARVQTNGRSRAVALRLEEWQGRWRCSAVDVG